MKPTKRFDRMSEIYKFFGSDMSKTLDFSEEAKGAMFDHESHGTKVEANNGFKVGKQYLNVQVSAWREDLRDGLLTKGELYADPAFPKWWLDAVLE